MPCPFDGEQFADFDLADACQVVDHLLLFVPELCFIRQMLPFASSAHAEMLAKRDSPFRRIRMEADGFPFRVTMFLAC